MIGAVRTAGDEDPAGGVDIDPARGEATVLAVAVEPRRGLRITDPPTADLPAGRLADVEQIAPLVQTDALVL